MADKRQHDPCDSFEGWDSINGDWDSQRDHQITKYGSFGDLCNCFGQPKPINGDGDEGLLKADFSKLRFCQLKDATFEGVFESATVTERSLRHTRDTPERAMKRIFL